MLFTATLSSGEKAAGALKIQFFTTKTTISSNFKAGQLVEVNIQKPPIKYFYIRQAF